MGLRCHNSGNYRASASCCHGFPFVVSVLFTVFEDLHLQINTAPGKTEALLQYRGRHSLEHREAWRCDDGRLSLKVPGQACSIHVVTKYKHLGVTASVNSGCLADVKQRSSKMMQAYGPISLKVFGSELVTQVHKLYFMQSLLM